METQGRPSRKGADLIQEVQETKVPYGALAVWFLGQESVIVKGGDIVIYIDPYVSDYLEKLGAVRTYPAPIAPEHITNADYYLITHEHLDHLDPGTVSVVAKQSPHTVFMAPACCREQLLGLGVNERQLVDADTNRLWTGDGLSIQAIPAAHESLEELPGMGHRYVGYLIRLNGVTFYHAGDTTIYPGLVDLLRRESVELGMLPINGRDFFRNERNLIGNMNYREAAELAYRAGFDMVIPLHYDIFAGNAERPGYFVDYMYDHFPEQKMHVMARGERFVYMSDKALKP